MTSKSEAADQTASARERANMASTDCEFTIYNFINTVQKRYNNIFNLHVAK